MSARSDGDDQKGRDWAQEAQESVADGNRAQESQDDLAARAHDCKS